MFNVVTTSPPQCYGFWSVFSVCDHMIVFRVGRIGPEPFVGWELGPFRHGQNPPSGVGEYLADRKLDPALVCFPVIVGYSFHTARPYPDHRYPRRCPIKITLRVG